MIEEVSKSVLRVYSLWIVGQGEVYVFHIVGSGNSGSFEDSSRASTQDLPKDWEAPGIEMVTVEGCSNISIYIYILYKCIVFICDIYLSYLREHCHKKSPPWNCLSSIDAIVEYCWHVTFANLTLPKMQTMILLSPSSFFANRHWPILTASLQNPKRSWWRVAIWEWSWAWTVYLSPRSCWLHVLNKLGFLHLGRAIFKASCALTSHWKTIGRLYR